MLEIVKVENLALLTQALLELDAGFVCLTGETGAGKSLVIDALSLLSGGRASSDLIRTGCKRAVVEAELTLDNPPSGFDLLDGARVFLRREIHRDGRARAFVNGAAVPISRLAQYAALGFELHGQHGQQHLLNEKYHLDLFDHHMNLTHRVSELDARVTAFKDAFRTYCDLRRDEGARLREMDVLGLQIGEIEAAALTEEDAELDSRLKKMRHLEQIRGSGFDMGQLIEDHLSPDLNTLKREVRSLSPFLPELAPYVDQLQSVHAVLNELSADLAALGELEVCAEELEALERRATTVNRLYLKYGSDAAQVLEELARLKDRRRRLERVESDAEARWQALETDYGTLQKLRADLDEARRIAIERFCQRVTEQLDRFACGGTVFDAVYTPAEWPEKLTPSSKLEMPQPRMRFLIAPNPGEGLRPLTKIASGGELSRMLLALITGFDRPTEKTLVFDEIDTGVSGETALKIGEKLAALGHHHQVVCVTHLAQVACFADQHVRIEKTVNQGRTTTRVAVCDHEQRVAELARLMGGDSQAEALREHAKAMMMQAAL